MGGGRVEGGVCRERGGEQCRVEEVRVWREERRNRVKVWREGKRTGWRWKR